MGSVGQGTKNLSEGTIKNLDDYLEGNSKLTKKSSDEIISLSKPTSKTLYRVEDSSWMGDNLKVGQEFTFNEPLKSFTDSESGVDAVVTMSEDSGLLENKIVIYKTIGKTNSFDTKKYSKNHSEEDEHLVGGKFKVLSIENGEKIERKHKQRKGGNITTSYDTVIITIQQI